MQRLPAVELKTGEVLEIIRVPPPCDEWGSRLTDYMYIMHPEYTNCAWHRSCARAVTGEFASDSSEVFFAGLLDGQIVGTCWYAAPADTLDVACFGRVLTSAPHRRKGISAVLCAATVEDFRARGGWCMHLGTSLTNPARFIYEGLGFRHYNFIEGDGTIMRLVLQGEYEQFEEQYYAAGHEVSLRPLNWGDLARAEVLYNLPHWFLKDYSQGIYAHTPFEGQYFDLMASVADQGETGLVLTTDEKRMVGMAYTVAPRAGAGAQRHLRVLEFLVHPNYIENAPQLIAAAAIDTPAEKLLAYSSALDLGRCEVLQEAGFVQEATLADALHDEQSEFDLYIYSLAK